MIYQIFCGSYRLPDGTAYRSYGVRWPGGRLDDLTLSREQARTFVQWLNEGGASPCHVQGLADDFLAGARLQTAGGVVK